MLPNSSACFGFCRHFECVLLDTIVKLPRALNTVLDVFSVLNAPAARTANLIKSVYQNKF